MTAQTVTPATVTDTLTAAGIEKVTEALKMVYGALAIANTGLTEAEIIFAAGTKRTATGVALAELVAKGLVARVDGSGVGKNRTPNTFTLALPKEAPAKKTRKSSTKATQTTTAEAPAATSGGARYGKAMTQILDFMKANAGEMFTVADLMKELDRPWYNATNQACKALAAHSDTGVTEVEGVKVRAYVYNG